MGTRHLITVKKDNKHIVAQYGQWDGYLEGQGKDIAHFLSVVDINTFSQKVDKCTFTETEELETLWEDASYRTTYLSRDLGSEVLNNIMNSELESIKLRDSVDFAKDSLFCEYGYVIDLDTNEFIIFEGFNTNPLNKDDMFFDESCNEEEYKPIREIKRFKISTTLIDEYNNFIENL